MDVTDSVLGKVLQLRQLHNADQLFAASDYDIVAELVSFFWLNIINNKVLTCCSTQLIVSFIMLFTFVCSALGAHLHPRHRHRGHLRRLHPGPERGGAGPVADHRGGSVRLS